MSELCNRHFLHHKKVFKEVGCGKVPWEESDKEAKKKRKEN